jgi:16S rRNA (guanine527-N7)-methyltransferase
MLSEDDVRGLLEPFGLSLSTSQVNRLLSYLDLLLRWNRKINLTAIRTPEECVTRNFGESLYLAAVLKIQGHLLDIGSGAGFPGLALKILSPELTVTLLEPIAKKRAFLKEVTRACGMSGVTVLGQRLPGFADESELAGFELVTARAVGDFHELVPSAAKCLKLGGNLCLWVGSGQIASIRTVNAGVCWSSPIPIPLSRQRIILIGNRC